MSNQGAKIYSLPLRKSVTLNAAVVVAPQSPQPEGVPNLYWPPPVPRAWSVSISDLGHDRIYLRHPIVVMLEDYAGVEIVASWPEIEAFGTGATESDALNALKDEVVQLFGELKAKPDKVLGKLPLRWKRALSAVVAARRSRSR